MNKDIKWDTDSIKRVIEFLESEMVDLEEELETTSYPPDVTAKLDITRDQIWLLSEMISENGWYYKQFNNKI